MINFELLAPLHWLHWYNTLTILVVGFYSTKLLGETKSPEVTLLKVLMISWDTRDLDSFILSDIPSYWREKEDLPSFINSLLSPQNIQKLPRWDFSNSLKLSFVKGSKKEYLFKLQRPGADHHSSCLKQSSSWRCPYFWTFTGRQRRRLRRCVSSLPLSTWGAGLLLPSNDLDLYKRLLKLSFIFKNVYSSTEVVHLLKT